MLAIQRCKACRRFFHPPIPTCLECRCDELAFEPVSGRGTVHARTIMHDSRVQGFGDAVPFAVVAVELDEQPGLLLVSNLLDIEPEEIRVGLKVEVDFELIANGFALPQFRLPRATAQKD